MGSELMECWKDSLTHLFEPLLYGFRLCAVWCIQPHLDCLLIRRYEF